MRYFQRIIGMLLGLCISIPLYADQTYVCTYGQQERQITVLYKNPPAQVPCEVQYTKNGVTKVLWHSATQANYCEQKTDAFVQKQLDWGWRCGDAKPVALPVTRSSDVPGKDEIVDYQRTAYIAQAIAATSPFRIGVIEYRMENGRYPKDLAELGYKREEMHDGSRISDLRLGKDGAILVLGNEKIGTNTVISLKPRDTLGGTSMEWQCSANIKTDKSVNCSYDPALKF